MNEKKTNSACDIVVSYILNKIASGDLETGDKLDAERDLSVKLNVSRATIREAVKVLNYLGFVDSTQGSGNYVADAYFNSVANIMSVLYQRGSYNAEDFTIFRQMLELQAFDIAITKASDEQKDELLQISKLLSTCRDNLLIQSLDKRFHFVLVEASCNELLLLNYRALSLVIDRYIHDTLYDNVKIKDPKFQKMADLHQRIAQSLTDGAAECGRKAIVDHFNFATK